MTEAKKQCSMIHPCWNFLGFPSSERLTSFCLLGNKKAPFVSLIDCERMSTVPQLNKKFILLWNTELLFLPLPKQQLSCMETRHFNATLPTEGPLEHRETLLLENTSCTSSGWSNVNSTFPWQPLAFQGLVHRPEPLARTQPRFGRQWSQCSGWWDAGYPAPPSHKAAEPLQETTFLLEGFSFLESCMSSSFLNYFSTYLKGASCPD